MQLQFTIFRGFLFARCAWDGAWDHRATWVAGGIWGGGERRWLLDDGVVMSTFQVVDRFDATSAVHI